MIASAAMPPRIIEKPFAKPLLLPRPLGFSNTNGPRPIPSRATTARLDNIKIIHTDHKIIHELNKTNQMIWDEILEGKALQ
jgi:hypothetical protein